MKYNKNISSVILIFLIVHVFLSCTEEGDLINPADDRDKFIGLWDVSENCFKTAYEVDIISDPANNSQVLIKNFWLIGFDEKPPYAIVAGNTITIPPQKMCYDESCTVIGNGKLDKHVIEWEYSVNDGADLDTCLAVYDRK